MILESLYPRGGWGRAINYVFHRVRRLPDPPHRIARGIACGVMVTFTPLFGLHFLIAAALAWLIRGNLLAAVFATLLGNPLTFPPIAAASCAVGNLMLDRDDLLDLHDLIHAFKDAGHALWVNLTMLLSGQDAHWAELADFADDVFLPYLLGGLVCGTAVGLLIYFLTYPLIAAYQRRRSRKLQKRLQARLRMRPHAAE